MRFRFTERDFIDMMAHALKQPVYAVLGDDAPCFHDEHVIGDRFDIADDMCGEQDGALIGQRCDEVAKDDALFGIETCGRFIKDEQLRCIEQCLRDADPSEHAPGALMFHQVQLQQQFFDALFALFFRDALEQPHIREEIVYAVAGIIPKMLWHIAQICAISVVLLQDADAVKGDLPSGGRQSAYEHADQCGLAAAIRAQQRVHAGIQREADVIHSGMLAKFAGKVFTFQFHEHAPFCVVRPCSKVSSTSTLPRHRQIMMTSDRLSMDLITG